MPQILSEYLVRAKLYPVKNYNLRSINVFFKCSKKAIGCSLCKSRENTVKHVASVSKKSYNIKTRISCENTFIIYSIECKNCYKEYVGQNNKPVYKSYLNHSYDILDKKLRNQFQNILLVPTIELYLVPEKNIGF